MAKDPSPKKSSSQLREKAEENLKKQVKKTNIFSQEDIAHELEVHRIELQLQNDELLSTQVNLLKSIEDYTELFEYAPIGYFILDKDGVITNANQKGVSQLGISKKQLTGKHLSIFLNSKSYQDEFYRHRNGVIEAGAKQQMECEIKRPDGSVFFAIIESLPVKDQNKKFKHLLSTIMDISARKEHEKALEMAFEKEKELNEMKSQFISIASHEFRTPLSTILLSAELIEKYNDPKDMEKKKNHIRKIRSSVSRLKEILIDFLSTNEIEKGKIKNNPELFNIVKFTKNIIEETKSFNGIHNIQYEHIGLYQNVMLDKTLLKTCMINLIINAYKYSPKGGAILITTSQNTPESLSISFTDFGIGIPENDKPYIFEQFFRAKNAENITGTGLGLSITHKLVTQMGGTLSFASQENEGTTFSLNF